MDSRCCTVLPCQARFFVYSVHKGVVHTKTSVSAAGGWANFAGHSFCIGAMITAADCSIEDLTIKALRRWHSSAFLAYLRMPREHLVTISHTLSKTLPREQA